MNLSRIPLRCKILHRIVNVKLRPTTKTIRNYFIREGRETHVFHENVCINKRRFNRSSLYIKSSVTYKTQIKVPFILSKVYPEQKSRVTKNRSLPDRYGIYPYRFIYNT